MSHVCLSCLVSSQPCKCVPSSMPATGDKLHSQQSDRSAALQRLEVLESQQTTSEMSAFITPAFTQTRPSSRFRVLTTPTTNGKHQTFQTPVAIAEPHIQPGVDFHGIPNPPQGTPLLLSDLRERLIRQEETIIFALIERAQFRHNPKIYTPGEFDIPYETCDFSQYLLYELEKVYAKVRRYTSPDEHPFAPAHILPQPILGKLEYPPTLKPNNVNVNNTIEKVYRNSIIPSICHAGDDQNYGSAATCDVACLQALSKRIHYGKFIAESKCQENESLYYRLAKRSDRSAIWNALSNLNVEKVLLKRVENKARSYGSDITVDGARDVFKVDPVTISDIYRDFIIPLTKEVEVDYILERYGIE